jgi:hypothetical protein
MCYEIIIIIIIIIYLNGFFQTRLSKLPSGAVAGSTLVVEGATFKLHTSSKTADIGISS